MAKSNGWRGTSIAAFVAGLFLIGLIAPVAGEHNLNQATVWQ